LNCAHLRRSPKIPLEQSGFVVQRLTMNPKWAEENLKIIRTLMERTAIYRRALAPIMILAGVMGIAGGVAGWLMNLNSNTSFMLFWIGVGVVSLVGALLLVRRQALKDSEPFWSPPTRRVGQALLPAFTVGLMVAVFIVGLGGFWGTDNTGLQLLVILLWTWFYGCAAHAAGFFMPRGVRLLGWIFIAVGGVLLAGLCLPDNPIIRTPPHLLMGAIFGVIHLAYGIYLYLTKQ
jgi:hypothetical protein